MVAQPYIEWLSFTLSKHTSSMHKTKSKIKKSKKKCQRQRINMKNGKPSWNTVSHNNITNNEVLLQRV